MRVWCQPFWAPKASSSADEYEDAYAWWPRGVLDGVEANHFRFAAADGATTSSYSKIWARQLARSFVRGRLRDDNLSEAVSAASRSWTRIVHGLQRNRPLPWYAEQKLDSGAFATLIGVTLQHDHDDGSGRWNWRALAVGDSCLVHLREGRIEGSPFPLSNSASFGASPVLLSTDAEATQAALRERKTANGVGFAGDCFYLMTDALAQWFLRECEAGSSPWALLQDLDRAPAVPAFKDWINELRRADDIRNDDVTLLRIEVER